MYPCSLAFAQSVYRYRLQGDRKRENQKKRSPGWCVPSSLCKIACTKGDRIHHCAPPRTPPKLIFWYLKMYFLVTARENKFRPLLRFGCTDPTDVIISVLSVSPPTCSPQ
ncbi:hypothetical protein I7I50_06761 [Histoplasma capsulatum G186AR]|uniref:Uncharacterized protein n=1 Tax=Ajellomyces capsulatus TaxID=5037 RepID=A0A8H8D3J6_AJECA|nr:hypothetical protein I7I52_10165 [Histoplasma capsulatum]QSS67624.1 hypothetical protein I7I50_06761 [Histoplasma capsulatum G186AR]